MGEDSPSFSHMSAVYGGLYATVLHDASTHFLAPTVSIPLGLVPSGVRQLSGLRGGLRII